MIETKLLFTLDVKLAPPLVIEGPGGERRFVAVLGGTVDGDHLKGDVLPVGEDSQFIRTDGTVELDIRTVIRTTSGQHIYLKGQGLRHGPPDVLARVADGEEVSPDEYYFRESLYFETGDPALAWLNRCATIGKGQRNRSSASIQVFEVL